MNKFFHEVWEGLNNNPKSLSSKYFYDEDGDELFQEIMETPEYYLTNCELEIFSQKTNELSAIIMEQGNSFDLVELGAGDAMKSSYLLRDLINKGADMTYYPIDISSHVISSLQKKLPATIPGIQIHGLNGEYFDMLLQMSKASGRRKVVLFLGSSIGNFPLDKTGEFLISLRQQVNSGDLLLIGFDLKKDPQLILAAYNDKAGATRRFNLNLLKRINKELDADFNIDHFEHSPTYDAETGACKSFLKSTRQQKVRIGEVGWVHFNEDEEIFMEISQKYSIDETDKLATQSSFLPVSHILDKKRWFLDAVWKAV